MDDILEANEEDVRSLGDDVEIEDENEVPVQPIGIRTYARQEFGVDEDERAAYAQEIPGHWTEAPLSRISDLKFAFTLLPQTLLKGVLNEWNAIFTKLKVKVASFNFNDVTVESIFYYFFNEFSVYVLEHVNTVLHRKRKPLVQIKQVLEFLATEMYLAAYNKSPTKMYKDPVLFRHAPMKKADYF